MENDAPSGIPISPTLFSIAKRFNIDVSAIADEVLRERILRDPVSALTSRMQVALLAARKTARDFGHNHVGTEHVFLAILLDPHSIPSQMLQDFGTHEQVVQALREMLGSESYNRGQ